MAQVLISFAALRREPGASAAERDWITSRAGQPGWLTGTAAGAASCGAHIAPVVTGSVDWQAIDAMTEVLLGAHGLAAHREPCGCTCGGCTCTPPAPLDAQAKAELRATLLALAADAMSGPGGLASYLRSRLLHAPWTAKPLPLDVGRAKDIPGHLRRAVILRDRHCAWPGGCDKPPAGCDVHHLIFRSRGGKTRLKDAMLDKIDYDGIDDPDPGLEPEPFCAECGADIGIFLRYGLDWRHYRGDGTVIGQIELFDPGHQPVVAWRLTAPAREITAHAVCPPPRTTDWRANGSTSAIDNQR